MTPYPISFLRALDDWLAGAPEQRVAKAERLRRELVHIEPEYRQCNVCCYRRIDFPQDSTENVRNVITPMLDLLHTGKLRESISSWSTDPEVAKAHVEGVQQGEICMIFSRMPAPNEVWLNIGELVKSLRFVTGFQGGSMIDHWAAREKEVILEVRHVSPEDVYSFGGFIGTGDQIRLTGIIDGFPPELFNGLELLMQRRGIKPGQELWLPEERSKALANRMQAHARQRYTHPLPHSEKRK